MSPLRVVGRTVGQALMSLGSRPARATLAILAVALGAAGAVAVPGISRSNQAAVAESFAAQSGDTVIFRPLTDQPFAPSQAQRAAGIPAVTSAGSMAPLAQVVAWNGIGEPAKATTPVAVVSTSLPAAAQSAFTQGGAWLAQAADAGARVALVAQGAATQLGLGLGPVTGRTAVFVGGVPYLVVGVFTEDSGLSLGASVLIPAAAAVRDFPSQDQDPVAVITRTQRENLALVASAGAVLLRPEDPGSVRAEYDSGSQELAALVTGQLDASALALTATGAVTAAILILVLLSSAIAARRAEIGLRRSLGASRRSIVRQIAVEAGLQAIAGAGLGVAAGVAVTFLVARLNHWPAIVPPSLVPLVAAEVLTACMVAGFIPALRASTIDPVDALTSQ